MGKFKRFAEKASKILNTEIIKKDNKIIKMSFRIFKIILIALLTVIGGIAVLFAVVYFYGNAVIFDYTDNIQCASRLVMPDYDPRADGYLMKYPHFANTLFLQGQSQDENGKIISTAGISLVVYGGPSGVDYKKVYIYEAVNEPIRSWVFVISAKYHDRVNVDYTVENNGKTLTVLFKGTAEQDGEKIPIEQKFVFDIENADVDNLPKWVNEDEMSDDARQWIKEWHNMYLSDDHAVPSWGEWLFG